MTTRGIFPRGMAFVALFPALAFAEPPTVDEFDLGDHWVDADAEGGWFAPWAPTLSDGAGSFRLDLSAGTGLKTVADDRESADGASAGGWSHSRDYYAFATLQVPLDGLLGRASSRTNSSEVAGATRLAQNQPNEEDTDDVSPPPTQRGTSESQTSEGEGTTDESPSAEPWGEENSSSETEFLVLRPAVVLAVVRELADRVGAPLDGARTRLASLARRSRWSGLSPELRLRGVLGFDRTTSTEESVGVYPGDTTVRGARDSLAEVRLTFRLDRLVLGDGEDSIERQRIDLEEEKRKLVEQALELFSKWRLFDAMGNDTSLPPDERIEALVAAESAVLQLHLLTGGWFQGRKTVDEVARRLPDVRAPASSD